MESQPKQAYRISGNFSISGAVIMLIGAAFWGASGTDLWQTLADNQMESYLVQSESVKHLLVVNTIFWILGVLLMGIAGKMMSALCTSNQSMSQVASFCFQSAIPIAIVSFITMLSLAIQKPTIEVAIIIGWIGARLDDLATMLIIGAGPLFVSIAGRNNWVPRWLRIWGYLAGFTGFLVVVSLLTGVVEMGFVIVPVGIGWMIAAGVVLRKRANKI